MQGLRKQAYFGRIQELGPGNGGHGVGPDLESDDLQGALGQRRGDAMSTLRTFYLATNYFVAVSHLCPELVEGANHLTAVEAESFSRQLVLAAGDGHTGKIRCQCSRVLWDLYHDPYDALPWWLGAQPFCACGRVVSECDGSRKGCVKGAKSWKTNMIR